LALTLTIFPPLLVNATLGFLLFTSHSLFALGLARLPFFQRHHHSPHEALNDRSKKVATSFDDLSAQSQKMELEQDPINLQTLIQGPSIVTRHPTLLSSIAGAGAGLVQGVAFTPIENVVR